MSVLRRLVGPSEVRNADPEVVQVLSERTQRQRVKSGVVVTDKTAMQHAAVWACVRLVSSTIGTMPVEVVRPVAGGGIEPLPTPALLTRPDGHTTTSTWIYQVVTSLLLRGNAYGEVLERERSGYPQVIRLLPPDVVVPDVRDGRVVGLDVMTDRRRTSNLRRVDVDDLWHVAAYTRPGSPIGMSPVAFAAESIGVGLAAERFGASWFGNGAHPSSVLQAKQMLTGEQAREVKQRWRESINSNDVAVLGGDWTYTPVQMAAEESQFLQAQEWSVSQIARVFGVPVELIGGATKGSSVTYANVESRNAAFLQFGLSLWIKSLEDALSAELPGTQRVRFRTEGLLRADTSARFNAYQTAIDAGFMTVNEARAREDLPPLETIDDPVGD